jgi:tRNA dimethylallyltransferase
MDMQPIKNLSIFILGTTGVGKTKLSVELAKQFAGQIVSCDSKQLYKYADIMTAKVT